MAQLEQGKAENCGMVGGNWNPDFAVHFNWCRASKASSVDHERRFRADLLSKCINICKPYQKQANEDVYKAEDLGCLTKDGRALGLPGAPGPRWHADVGRWKSLTDSMLKHNEELDLTRRTQNLGAGHGHFDFCMGEPDLGFVARERQARTDGVAKCARCKGYADRAVELAKDLGPTLKNCLTPENQKMSRWFTNPEGHLGWCMTVRDQRSVDKEAAARERFNSNCDICKKTTADASFQREEAERIGCPWSYDGDLLERCISSGNAVAWSQSVLGARNQQLRTCAPPAPPHLNEWCRLYGWRASDQTVALSYKEQTGECDPKKTHTKATAGRWAPDVLHHINWCKETWRTGKFPAAAEAEEKARQDVLDSCPWKPAPEQTEQSKGETPPKQEQTEAPQCFSARIDIEKCYVTKDGELVEDEDFGAIAATSKPFVCGEGGKTESEAITIAKASSTYCFDEENEPKDRCCTHGKPKIYAGCGHECTTNFLGTMMQKMTPKVPQRVACRGGMQLSADGRCACPDGMQWLGGRCRTLAQPAPSSAPGPAPPPVVDDTTAASTVPDSCPPGTRRVGRSRICLVIRQPAPSAPPVEDTAARKEPPIICQPGSRRIGRRCFVVARPQPLPPVACAAGTRRLFNRCVPVRCPRGTIGTYPKCGCPLGMMGVPPNCCRPGTHYVDGKCVAPSQPAPTQAKSCRRRGMIGIEPNCFCRAGTVFRYGRCRPVGATPAQQPPPPAEPSKCRGNMIGKPPFCRCPPGKRLVGGRFCLSKKPKCPPGQFPNSKGNCETPVR